MKNIILLFFATGISYSLMAQSVATTSTQKSQESHLSVVGKTIIVNGWGSSFDGSYDTEKLSKDSCISGDCKEGHGRKVLASITPAGARIRIMEGKFKHHVFLGEGVMLIDGESDVLDGTYELGKFKVSYAHNTLQSKTKFHSKITNEDVGGNFSGYLDDGIGKALPEYQQFVVCKFEPEYHAKPTTVTVWERDIYLPAYNKWLNARLNSPEFKAAQAKNAEEIERKYGPQNNSSNNSANNSAPSGRQTEKLTIRRTCGVCSGTGKTYHNVTEYTYSGSTRIATSRRVPESCSACHGSGYVQ